MGRRLLLTKHHGAGNDFLVALGVGANASGGVDVDAVTPSLAAALCDRHRGVGADGLLSGRGAEDGECDVVMRLWNADGSSAEMSGNGIRCLVQAAVDAGLVDTGIVDTGIVRVGTAAGTKDVAYEDLGTGAGWASVSMGSARLGDEPAPSLLADAGVPPGQVERARFVSIGNPHLVLWAPTGDIDIEKVGARLDATVAGGVNVEAVHAGAGRDEIELAVWERGVGMTLACGTGACAAAAAAHDWGWAGPRVLVRSAGGALEVRLGADGTMTLGGPVQRVAAVTVDVDDLGPLDEDAVPPTALRLERRRDGVPA